MDYRAEYDTWKSSPFLSADEKAELVALTDEEEIRERFSFLLSFGTAGLRGIAETGLNRLNRYTLCHAVRAFARHLGSRGTVIVCRDARLSSMTLARAAAEALAEQGKHVLFFKDCRPTPQLSFAVRHFHADGGINITASHNPKEYNGCKFYDCNGAQLGSLDTDAISAIMAKMPVLAPAPKLSFEQQLKQGNIEYLQCDSEYIDAVCASAINRDEIPQSDLSVVYTPFHGVGGSIMPIVFERAGLKNIAYQPQQMIPDGHFPTLASPNPEQTAGFALSIELAHKTDADIICATDPDADRAAIAVKTDDGAYRCFTGNETGALLTDYLLRESKTENAAVIKTIVSTPLTEDICDHYGAKCFSTFTGFKNMAEKLEEVSGSVHCLMCFEESIGYMIGDHIRDKDGISATLMICEMAAWYKRRGKTLIDALEELYARHGRYQDHTLSIYRYGMQGKQEIDAMMHSLRLCPPEHIDGLPVVSRGDYLTGENTHIKGSNVLEYRLHGGSRLLVRPSGTEPKIKIYALAKDHSAKALTAAIEKILLHEGECL